MGGSLGEAILYGLVVGAFAAAGYYGLMMAGLMR